MATQIQPNSSSLEDVSPISQALSRRKYPRRFSQLNSPVLDAVADEEEIDTTQEKKKKKKRKKLGSSASNRIWNEEDELTVLKGLVDYQVETGLQPNSDWDAFYRFIGDSIVSKFSKEQLLSKISKMKRKFLVHIDQINQGNDPLFIDPKAHELSNIIWGQNDSQFAGSKQQENDNCEGLLHAEIDYSGDTSPSFRRKSEPSKKKKKLNTPVIWTVDDEITILKGLIDYRRKTKDDPNFDWNTYFDFVKGSVLAKVSKKQLFSKIKDLKRLYQVSVDRISKGLDPQFPRDTNSQVFEYSYMLWNQNEAEVTNASLENAVHTENDMNLEETCKENEQVVNAELVSQNEMEKSLSDGKLVREETTEDKTADEEHIECQFGVNAGNKKNENTEETFREDEQVANVEPLNGNVAEKIIENKTTGKDGHDNDELCYVKDAFETMMSQSLSGYQKKIQMEKLMKFETRKIKELSNEWKEICDEEAKLTMKTLLLSIKLAEAANEG